MKKKSPIPFLLLGGGALLLWRSLSKKKYQDYPPLPPFTQNRVKVGDYERLPTDSPLLVPVASSGRPQRLHVLAAKRLDALKEAAARDGFNNILISSGWRPHRWRSREHYEQVLRERYDGSVAVGRGWLAYNSPHETGLAFDFGSHGLAPISKTNARQKRTPFYKWLVANAHRFGITPYAKEAWHWEVKVPREAWASGEEFTDDFGVFV